ncbi:hypothetical protein GCM10022267_01030 [Lentzea roselyniae]|uniref:Uncharacterized protein n=1 Tax=Lentzea roselyniae TaxID=531940 RepID=A0ABP6ZYM4_9PSEU
MKSSGPSGKDFTSLPIFSQYVSQARSCPTVMRSPRWTKLTMERWNSGLVTTGQPSAPIAIPTGGSGTRPSARAVGGVSDRGTRR